MGPKVRISFPPAASQERTPPRSTKSRNGFGLSDWQTASARSLSALTIDNVKKHRIAAYSEGGDTRVDSWSVRQALVGAVTLNNVRYALNEGAWYRIDQAYKDAADAAFERLKGVPDPVFIPFRKTIETRQKGKKPKAYYQSEETYNNERAQASGYLLLDRRLIEIPDEPGRLSASTPSTACRSTRNMCLASSR